MQQMNEYDRHKKALEDATTLHDLRTAMARCARDPKMQASQVEHLRKIAEFKGRWMQGIPNDEGKGSEAGDFSTSTPDTNASESPKPSLGHELKDLVEQEINDRPAELVVREPALPVIDAASLGVAMKMWQQLGMTIEANTPESTTLIGGKKWRNAEFWRAARLAYGIDRPVIESQHLDYTNKRATFTVRVNMGRRYASATAVAEGSEKGKADAPMNTLAGLAYTRALNRASRECIGLGTKSAEEVESDD